MENATNEAPDAAPQPDERCAMTLTARAVQHLKPAAKPYYQNDTVIPGFSIRVGAASAGGRQAA